MSSRSNRIHAVRRDGAWAPPGRLRIRHVPLGCVARFSALLGVAFSAAVITAVVAIYTLAAASGALGSFDRFVADTLGAKSFSVELVPIVFVMLVLSAVTIAFVTMFGVLVAVAFNWYGTLGGGLEFDVDAIRMRPALPARPRPKEERVASTSRVGIQAQTS